MGKFDFDACPPKQIETGAIRLLDWAFSLKVGNATGKMILCIMARFANGSGVCFAAISTIATTADCQPAAVRSWIKKFLVLGLIEEMPKKSGYCTRRFIVNPGAIESGNHPLSVPIPTPVISGNQNQNKTKIKK